MTTTLFTNAHIATGEPGSTAASTLPLQDILVTDGVHRIRPRTRATI